MVPLRRHIMIKALLTMLCVVFCTFPAMSFEKDVIKTSGGDLEITFIGHGTMMFKFAGKIIHIDPFSRVADYKTLPKADLIFLTHNHRDHLDMSALKHIVTKSTDLVFTELCSKKTEGNVMKNGDIKEFMGIKVHAVPAYNLKHKRKNGKFYHPKGEGNGYVLTFGNKRLYIAGDTENVPEMKSLKNIDYAFLPMNLPYTMTSEMAADAARSFKPKVLYPYHYGKTDPTPIVKLLKNSGIEVRIRKMR